MPPAYPGASPQRPRQGWHRFLPTAKIALALLALLAVVVVARRAPSAEADFRRAFARFEPSRLSWLGAAALAEAGSVFCYALAQRRLLIAGGSRINRRSAFALALGATGIAVLVPAGVVPSGGWLVMQLRRRSVGYSLALWEVLGSGFVAAVSLLALLLVGAAVAGVDRPILLAGSGVVLVAGSAGFVAVVHRLHRVERFLSRHHARRGVRLVHKLATRTSNLVRHRAGLAGGTEVFAWCILNWISDGAVLAACFAFVGEPVPWKGLLFAYTAAQVAGSVVPLPAGIGVVEGGLVGAFSLAGTPVGMALVATLVYRVISFWALAGVGSLVALLMSHGRGAGPAPAERVPAYETLGGERSKQGVGLAAEGDSAA